MRTDSDFCLVLSNDSQQTFGQVWQLSLTSHDILIVTQMDFQRKILQLTDFLITLEKFIFLISALLLL